MANKTVKTRVQVKRGSSSDWSKATSFTPLEGEIIFYTDLNKVKIGDGTTVVGSLPFVHVDKSEIDNWTHNHDTLYYTETEIDSKLAEKLNTSTKYAGSSSVGGAATSANKVNAAVTFNSSGSGAASGTTFDGSSAKTISYNTIGAAAASHGTHVTADTVKSALGTGTGTSKYLREDGTWVTPPNTNTDAIYSGIGTCSTAASTAAKVVVMPKFALATNATILLRVSNTNSATSGVTLNVNSTGAKSIYIGGSAWSTSNQLNAGDYLATYDGTYWKLTRIYLTDNNTTYSSKTAASGGTDVSLVTTGEKYTWNNKQNAINSSNKLAASNVSGLATVATSGSYNDLSNKPTIPTVPTTLKNPNSIGFKVNSETSAFVTYDGSAAKTITIKPSTTNGAFTISDGTTTKTIQLAGKFTDTTYSSKTAASGGTTTSLVTTGEKYTWNNKQDAITLTANKALISNSSGKVAISPVSSTELSHLSGVTWNVQDQLDVMTKAIGAIGPIQVTSTGNFDEYSISKTTDDSLGSEYYTITVPSSTPIRSVVFSPLTSYTGETTVIVLDKNNLSDYIDTTEPDQNSYGVGCTLNLTTNTITVQGEYYTIGSDFICTIIVGSATDNNYLAATKLSSTSITNALNEIKSSSNNKSAGIYWFVDGTTNAPTVIHYGNYMGSYIANVSSYSSPAMQYRWTNSTWSQYGISSNTGSKIFLTGITNQTYYPQAWAAMYSHDTAFVDTSGRVNSAYSTTAYPTVVNNTGTSAGSTNNSYGVSARAIYGMKAITQANYDSATKSDNMLYFIID